jgi:integrase
VVRNRSRWNSLPAINRAKNRKIAGDIEATFISDLAKGASGIRKKKSAATLEIFFEKDFLPFTDAKHSGKPATARYYHTGAKSLLLDPSLAGMRLDEISDQHAFQYAKRNSALSPSTINCGLRTLRRALYLAAEWGMTDRRPKITLAKGERQRDRVLSDEEITAYLEACEQPWRDVATIMLGSGMRPAEVLALRWENILLSNESGLVRVTDGKSKAARRVLPMVAAIYDCLLARWDCASRPKNGLGVPVCQIRGGPSRNVQRLPQKRSEKSESRRQEEWKSVSRPFRAVLTEAHGTYPARPIWLRCVHTGENCRTQFDHDYAEICSSSSRRDRACFQKSGGQSLQKSLHAQNTFM